MIDNYGGWNVEVSTMGMMMVLKLISLSMCYRDGAPEFKDSKEFHSH
jgi:hypothetical protein